jgi:hypothetical protein
LGEKALTANFSSMMTDRRRIDRSLALGRVEVTNVRGNLIPQAPVPSDMCYKGGFAGKSFAALPQEPG